MSTSNVWNGAGRRIFMNEVGTRDGLQMEQAFVPTEDKIALVNALSEAGLSKIEVTAFVSPKAIPALRDGEIVMREITRRPGTVYTALVPNVRGAERAIDARTDELNLVMSVSETHNLCNLRMQRSQSFEALRQVIATAQQAATPVNVSLSCCFGCPMEGDVAEAEVLAWVQRFADLGVQGITLCDTTGMAYPNQVHSMVLAFKSRWPQLGLTLHFHNTRGMALANVLASIAAGADRFDASIGGLGGCPYAPGASGNACTEEIVHALQLMGYDTGTDLDRIVAAARSLPALIGHETPSQIVKAGARRDLHRPPADFAEIKERAQARA
ncbi:hydroxymethylglutaryl-CoA lyase [Comamonas thiooxydans]|uniref:hydroxymethylglutaryl-CoA lyase n=1 Tax=Comamonas thiooxydans TaxID=363952 RepID=UPI000B41563C|nr:hydroxymethylglutaryl-CoA lyase [Comamonas thiooxydans]UUE94429.1 hydroxymethylglutaryl-CoA lyase [Comamonas thiooxydans]BDB69275.1 hydroxymethylglutaryl-CoA lyase [Comamonas thiooxydans]